MISGTYWEFFCTECGYFPQEKIQNDSDNERAKKVIVEKIKEHQKKTNHIPKKLYKKLIDENIRNKN